MQSQLSVLQNSTTNAWVSPSNQRSESKSCLPLCLQKVIDFCTWFWHLITCGCFSTNKGRQTRINATYASRDCSIKALTGAEIPVKKLSEVPSALDVSNARPVLLIAPSLDSFVETFEKFDDLTCKPVMKFVYVLTNEYGLNKTQLFLAQRPLVEEGCHIGFSGMHNFDIIANRKSKYALIFDVNNDNTLFLRNVLKILKQSSNRLEFVRNMEAYLRPMEAIQDPRLAGVLFSRVLRLELDREGCWLNTDVGFDHVRSVALSGNICPITQNIINTEVFGRIAALLRERSIQIDTLYLSNIGNYMLNHQKAFCDTARSFLDQDTIVIHCVARLDWNRPPEEAFEQRSLIQSTCLASDLMERNKPFFSTSLQKEEDQALIDEGERRFGNFVSYWGNPEVQAAIIAQREADEVRRLNLVAAGIVGLFD